MTPPWLADSTPDCGGDGDHLASCAGTLPLTGVGLLAAGLLVLLLLLLAALLFSTLFTVGGSWFERVALGLRPEPEPVTTPQAAPDGVPPPGTLPPPDAPAPGVPDRPQVAPRDMPAPGRPEPDPGGATPAPGPAGPMASDDTDGSHDGSADDPSGETPGEGEADGGGSGDGGPDEGSGPAVAPSELTAAGALMADTLRLDFLIRQVRALTDAVRDAIRLAERDGTPEAAKMAGYVAHRAAGALANLTRNRPLPEVVEGLVLELYPNPELRPDPVENPTLAAAMAVLVAAAHALYGLHGEAATAATAAAAPGAGPAAARAAREVADRMAEAAADLSDRLGALKSMLLDRATEPTFQQWQKGTDAAQRGLGRTVDDLVHGADPAAAHLPAGSDFSAVYSVLNAAVVMIRWFANRTRWRDIYRRWDEERRRGDEPDEEAGP